MDDIDRKAQAIFDDVHAWNKEYPEKSLGLAYAILGRSMALADRHGIKIEAVLAGLRALEAVVRRKQAT